jgi:hypothetical protein
VVTKDQDFRDGHLLARSPRQLLVVATGNITNDALLSLFELHLDAIVSAVDEADFVELSQDALALGRRREDAEELTPGDRNRPSAQPNQARQRVPSNCTLKGPRVPNRAESTRNPPEFPFRWVPKKGPLPGAARKLTSRPRTSHSSRVEPGLARHETAAHDGRWRSERR